MSGKVSFAPRVQSTGQDLKLSMQKLWLTGQVLTVGARLWIRHEFVSQESQPVEVIYGFMLPRDASVRRFRVSGADFRVDSELRPTKEAHKYYEQGIQGGSLSTLLRQYGDGLINLTVGNIRPEENVVVLVEVLTGVELHDGSLRMRFPFTLAPSYHPQARSIEVSPGLIEIELPNEQFDDLILPQFAKSTKHLHQVGFCIDVEMGSEIQKIASPSHALSVQTQTAQLSRVSLSRESDLPDRDLVLDVETKAAGPSVFGGVDSGGKGRFAATIPSTQFGRLTDSARRLVILLDRSGSMQGPPLKQAKKAIEACLGALDEQDQFGLVAFDDEVEVFKRDLSKSSIEHRRAAQEFLRGIESRGGTQLAAGVEAAATLLNGGPGDILIITDGQVFATEGILERARCTGVRIHCLGIGSASQDRFLAQLAGHTGGVSRFLTPAERVDLPAVELFASIGRPVAQQVAVNVDGVTDSRIIPEPTRHVFSGVPLLIFGELTPGGDAQLRIGWQGAAAEAHLDLPIPMSATKLADTLKLLQGARIISDLESCVSRDKRAGVAAQRESSRMDERLVQLSLEYGLASSQMSLVAVVQRPGDTRGQIPKTQIVPVGIPVELKLFGEMAAGVGTGGGLAAGYLLLGSPDIQNFDYFDGRSARGVKHMLSGLPSNLPTREPKSNSRPGTLESTEDVLVVLAGMLDPDGGMPGKTDEIRIVNSLAALLCFVSQGSTNQHGPFRVHVQKLLQYLKPELLKHLTPTNEEPAVRALNKIATGNPPKGNWLQDGKMLAESKGIKVDVFWRQLMEAVHI